MWLREQWDRNSGVEWKWNVLKSALCDAAKDELGYENRKQPDWFRESKKDLKILIAERNRLYALWISTRLERDRKKHARARRLARQAIEMLKMLGSSTKH